MEFLPVLQNPIDDLKPSLFELLSQQQLSSLLPPTLRYILAVAAQRHPRYLLRLLNSFDELYALLALLIDRHYLRTRGASFTEAFYGLRRERAPVAAGGSASTPRASLAAGAEVRDALRLRDRGDVWKGLVVAVLLPYVRRKLDADYEMEAPRAALGVAAAARARPPEGATWRQTLLHYYRWFLRAVYPSVNAAYCFAMLVSNLAYLFDGSRFHNPINWLIGQRLRRSTPADQQALDQLLAGGAKAARLGVGGTSGIGGSGSSGRTGWAVAMESLGPGLYSGLSILLPAGIFALKFLEWWHASDFSKHLARRTNATIDLPAPLVAGLDDGILRGKSKETSDGTPHQSEFGPREEEEEEEGGNREKIKGEASADDAPISAKSLLPILTVSAPADSSLCPICEGGIVTATACQTGVVFCYSCIHRWITGTHPRQEDFMADKAGAWESGEGRCAVTGRRVLGGADGLRRIMV